VIQGGASSPRIFTIFVNSLQEHLTGTGKALGISHGIEETEQFNGKDKHWVLLRLLSRDSA
jgi:hypothetical protein